jgi:hypothetical protein
VLSHVSPLGSDSGSVKKHHSKKKWERHFGSEPGTVLETALGTELGTSLGTECSGVQIRHNIFVADFIKMLL